MTRFPNWRLWTAIVLCAAGVLAAVMAISNSRPRVTIATSGADGPNLRLPASGLVGVRTEGADFVVDRITATLKQRVSAAALPQGEQLVSDADRILRAWFGGDAQAYLTYLRDNGHTPPPAPLWTDPEQREKLWTSATEALREARFDPDGITVRSSFENGEAILNELKTTTSWRFDKLSEHDSAFPDRDHLKRLGVTIREILVPMRTTGLSYGATYDGLLALSYVRDSGSGRWTLVAVSVYGLPEDDTARLPPF